MVVAFPHYGVARFLRMKGRFISTRGYVGLVVLRGARQFSKWISCQVFYLPKVYVSVEVDVEWISGPKS